MATEEFLNQLFDAHTKNLNEFHPGMGEVVVCPICLSIIPREAISQKYLTDGHVWPKGIRNESKVASSMHLLLCNKCNHTAGSRGDKQMQVFELVKKGEETGDLGRRRVQIIKNPGEKPIDMNVAIIRNLDDNSFTITGRVDKDMNWLDGSPEDQARFREVYKKQEQVTVIVHPYPEFKSKFVPAGWMTSAYLMAFYHLGYRYVLDSTLAPVRDYILKSFEPDAEKNLVLPDDDDFSIRKNESDYFPDPELFFVCPLEKNQKVYLQVNFLKYEIRLPFRYSRLVFEWIVKKSIPDIEDKFPELQKAGGYLYLPIKQTKADGNLTIYDFLLGKTIPRESSASGEA
jgi:hypothetical protein